MSLGGKTSVTQHAVFGVARALRFMICAMKRAAAPCKSVFRYVFESRSSPIVFLISTFRLHIGPRTHRSHLYIVPQYPRFSCRSVSKTQVATGLGMCSACNINQERTHHVQAWLCHACERSLVVQAQVSMKLNNTV